jgi:phosphatidylserine/phosphatidylglycerophosphate/cardiolipin synthase-like enzyme
MVVRRSRDARLYGNVTVTVAAGPAPTPATAPPNPFQGAARRGISNAGILGLGQGGALPKPLLESALSLAGEAQPRDASRLPTMARRDLLVAGRDSSGWKAVLAAGRLDPETQNADARLGAPGSAGGRETQVAGVATQGGPLALDIARAALRRTTNLASRLAILANSRWNEPAEPAELAAATAPTTSAGTFAAAVLQTVAPKCETPELSLFATLMTSTTPTTFDDLVNQFVPWLISKKTTVIALVPQGIPHRQDIIDAINGLDQQTIFAGITGGDTSTQERVAGELARELTSSIWGRRDALWALQGAFASARSSIYIESAGFTPTARAYNAANGDPQPPFAVDLLAVLGQRLVERPNLRVTICTPKFPDFAPGYESFAAYESAARRAAILALTTPTNTDPRNSQVVAFHPIGFPGRPSRLETTVIIVDDRWAMVGSSTLRRRGLTFDGGSDVVFTDTDLERGTSPTIRRFRMKLMAQRLGIPGPETLPTNTFVNHADYERLYDGAEAFHVARERLRAGGLGVIERLWNGETNGEAPPPAAGVAVANPDGQEVDDDTFLGALVAAALANIASQSGY